MYTSRQVEQSPIRATADDRRVSPAAWPYLRDPCDLSAAAQWRWIAVPGAASIAAYSLALDSY